MRHFISVVYLFNGGDHMARGISIHDVASTFLSFELMTHKKLQKLCYYAQAWHLALMNEPLFNDRFEAWIHGPVCPSLYDSYKGYGWQNIEQCEVPHKIKQNNEIYEFLKQIYRIYGDLDGNELELLTRMEQPWRLARGGLKPWQPSTKEIDQDIMRKYYLEEFERSQND